MIGLDFGEKRIGISMSDPAGRIAYPLETVPGGERFLERLTQILSQGEVGRIIIGLPRNMDGSLGPKAKEVLHFAKILQDRFGIPVETWDERLTTVEAERYLRESGLSPRKRKLKVDRVASQILLQSYLDARAASSPPDSVDPPGAGKNSLQEI